jgi:hypothetical protein
MGQLTQTTAEVQTNLDKTESMGWANYADTAYTSGSPLSIASARVQLTNNKLGSTTDETDLPDGVTEFVNSSSAIIASSAGDAFDVRIFFKAKVNALTSYFDMEFDIGNGGSVIIAAQTLIAPKGSGVETSYVVDLPLFALATFVANGCKIYLDTTSSGDTLTAYEIRWFIKRDYTRG